MKRLLLILTLVLVTAALPAFDWGGFLDNTTGYRTPRQGADSGLVQSTTLALWTQAKLGSWNLDAQGSYTFTPTTPILFDVDRLTLGTNVIATEAGATTVGFRVGRELFTGPTTYTLRQTLDGITLQINRSASSFRFGLATTALLQKPTNSIVLGALDTADLSDASVLFGPRRLIATLDVRFLEAIGGQHLGLGAIVQEDLRPEAELTPVGTNTLQAGAGGRYDTQHLSVALSGGVGPGLFQTVSYTASSGRRLEFVPDSNSTTGSSYQYRAFLGHLVNAELTWFIPQALNSRARFFGQFSTGESESTDAFVPLAGPGYSDVFTLEPGNSAHLGLSYSLRPLAAVGADVLQTELASVLYFRTTGTGPVSDPAVDPFTEGTYVGTDLNLTLIAVPLSDVRLVLKNGIFLPNASVMGASNQNAVYQVTLQGVLRF